MPINEQKRILIVEDNALNMRLFNDLLEAHGHLPFGEQNAENVLNRVTDLVPDLILMDIQLPEFSGFDLIKLIKAHENLVHIPIIAITAFAMRGDEDKILQAGFVDYISKPISVMGFLETVTKHLENTHNNTETLDPIKIKEAEVSAPINQGTETIPSDLEG